MNAAAAGIVQTHDFPRFSHIEARAAHARRASLAACSPPHHHARMTLCATWKVCRPATSPPASSRHATQ
ncbi:hypothetical protein QTN24_19760 [Cupriavidus sp. SZY C1]|uniref:hypothetical protein n=1 Tax=Cupriavidus sp. SZY C1 TaxID=3055037 RepID=UPI0028BC22BD|nr:hypothetical protein [Cupriavidus sp. SZY C1]MDT6963744.1 hypothetical protein [Cupriavidus sp. SZY C1]